MRHQQHHEGEFLRRVADWVVVTQPQLYEIDRELTKIHETTRTFEPLKHGEFVCDRRVVQYRPRESHLQVTIRRYSEGERRDLHQAGLCGKLREWHRRNALLRHRTKAVTLVGHMSLKLPPEVEARIRMRGDDPEAFKANMLDALRRGEHQRFSSWKAGRSPELRYGYRIFDVPLLASVDEAAVAIGLPLAQEGVLADDTVKPLLLKAMGVPASLVDSVWERLKLHYSDSQYPLSLKAYIKRIVDDLRPPQGDEVFQDKSGTEYWTVHRAAEELGKAKTTIYRWIKNGVISQARFGVQEEDIEHVKATYEFDHSVVALLCKARKITRDSAERAYRRLCNRLNIKARTPIKSDEEKAAIMGALRADPKLVSLRARWKPGVVPADEQE